MKKYGIWLLVTAFTAFSCSLSEKDAFDKPSSERLSEYLEQVQMLLLNQSDNGWLMEYYPGASYAATTYVLQFDGQRVKAAHESDPFTWSDATTYRLTTDDGPVLSFDGYNELLHKYATPSQSKYQARGGDFEFAIVSADSEKIVLRGRRSRNLCTLRPLDDDPEEYLLDVADMDAKIDIAAVAVQIKGQDIIGYLDAATRTLSIGDASEDEANLKTVRYVVTPEGIRFNSEWSIGGQSFTEWEYFPGKGSSDPYFEGGGYEFEKTIPKGWVAYEDYLGDWTLDAGGYYQLDVKLVQDEAGSTYILKGLYSSHDVSLGYNAGRGRLTWVRQTIGGSGKTEYVLCPWDSQQGYLTWLEGVGMYGYVTDTSGVPDSMLVKFADNHVWEEYTVDGWISYAITGEKREAATGSYTFANGEYQLPGPVTLSRGLDQEGE